ASQQRRGAEEPAGEGSAPATSFRDGVGEGRSVALLPSPSALGGGRREFIGGGVSLLHGERTGTQRTLRITRIDNGDALCPKIGGVEYGAVQRSEAEGAVSSNGPPGLVQPIYYPPRYFVLDVGVVDHARRETRAQDVERGHVRDRVRADPACVGRSGRGPSRQGRAGGQC